MNSVLQLLAAMPEFGRYCTAAQSIFRSAPSDPTQDAVTQLAKVAEGLLSARYAAPPLCPSPGPHPAPVQRSPAMRRGAAY